MRCAPVFGDGAALADPDIVVAGGVVEKAGEAAGAGRVAGQAHVQADRHHFRRAGAAFGQQQVETFLQEVEEVGARGQDPAPEFGIVAGRADRCICSGIRG